MNFYPFSPCYTHANVGRFVATRDFRESTDPVHLYFFVRFGFRDCILSLLASGSRVDVNRPCNRGVLDLFRLLWGQIHSVSHVACWI